MNNCTQCCVWSFGSLIMCIVVLICILNIAIIGPSKWLRRYLSNCKWSLCRMVPVYGLHTKTTNCGSYTWIKRRGTRIRKFPILLILLLMFIVLPCFERPATTHTSCVLPYVKKVLQPRQPKFNLLKVLTFVFIVYVCWYFGFRFINSFMPGYCNLYLYSYHDVMLWASVYKLVSQYVHLIVSVVHHM